MPLPLIDLDNRRWADLVEEGTSLIPRHAPGWTDHNIHDPGITLIELFAWLAEAALYRLNRVSERHRRKFLALLGFRAEPPRSAHAVLTVDPEAATTPFDLPAGVVFDAAGRDGRAIPFVTMRDLHITGVTLVAVQVDTGDGIVRDRTDDWRDGLGVKIFGTDPRVEAAVYFGFSAIPTQEPVALALRFRRPGNDCGERARIIREAAEQRRACAPVLPDIHCDDDGAPEPSPDLLPPHHSARVVWEVLTGSGTTGWQALEPVALPAHPTVGQVVDDTRAMTLDGLVEIDLPAGTAKATIGEVTASLFHVRCRLAAGGYDAPPVLLDLAPNAVEAVQASQASQTFVIGAAVVPAGTAPVPGASARLAMQLDANGVVSALTFLPPATAGAPDVTVWSYTAPGATAGEITLDLVVVGTGTGRPLPPLALGAAPVRVDTLRLYTHAAPGWQEWTRRDDFLASRRTDFHYVVGATGGTVAFGDGERGRVPPAGELVVAVYRSTSGDAGNVPARAVRGPSDTLRNRVLLQPLLPAQEAQLQRVTNRAATVGGAAEETLARTTARAVETLHAHYRVTDLANDARVHTLDQLSGSDVRAIRPPTNAVNLLDIERLALAVPGTRVARARACASVHPDYPCLDAPGVVTVVVLPAMPVARPRPTPGLLDAVRRYLARRRMVCTRLEVVGPEYLVVDVTASLEVEVGANPARVKAAVVEALIAFLDPHTGGPSGLGWPFGRTVFRTEILQRITAVHGVDHVLALSLRSGSGEPQCGDIPVCPTWLVAPGRMQIDVSPVTSRPRRLSDIAPCPSLDDRPLPA